MTSGKLWDLTGQGEQRLGRSVRSEYTPKYILTYFVPARNAPHVFQHVPSDCSCIDVGQHRRQAGSAAGMLASILGADRLCFNKLPHLFGSYRQVRR